MQRQVTLQSSLKRNRQTAQKRGAKSSIPQGLALFFNAVAREIDLPGIYDRFSTLPNLWASPTGPTEAGLP